MDAIHISQARRMLDRGTPVSLTVLKKNGSLMHADEVISLRYDHYKGTRRIKFLRSGQIRSIRDVCILRLNDYEVFL